MPLMAIAAAACAGMAFRLNRAAQRERALWAGVVCYLSKPFDENDLLACIHSSLNI